MNPANASPSSSILLKLALMLGILVLGGLAWAIFYGPAPTAPTAAVMVSLTPRPPTNKPAAALTPTAAAIAHPTNRQAAIPPAVSVPTASPVPPNWHVDAIGAHFPAPTATAIPGPARMASIEHISFIDAQHGWVIGPLLCSSDNCPLALRATTNGGLTWQALPTPTITVDRTASWPLATQSLRFVTPQEGWVLGGTKQLFVTRDGGMTWQQSAAGGDVLAVEPTAGTTWILKHTSLPSTPSSVQLLSSTDMGRSWRALAHQPVISGTPIQLLRSGATDAWVVSTEENHYFPPQGSGEYEGARYRINITATHDQGQTWQQLPDSPCTIGMFARVGALPGGLLWLIVGNGDIPHRQDKFVCTSSDSGHHWKLIGSGIYADDNATPTFPGYSQISQNLSIEGHLYDFILISPEHAWFTTRIGPIESTRDGGRTWQIYGAVLGNKASTDFPVPALSTIDADHLWIGAGDQITILNYVDGTANLVKVP